MNEKPSVAPYHSGKSVRAGREIDVASHLLTASGVLAIGLVAVVSGMQFGYWPQLLVFIPFTVIFVSLANPELLGLSKQVEVLGILTLFLLSILSWFTSPTDVILILTIVMMAQAPYILSRGQCWKLMLVSNFCYLLVAYLHWNSDYIFLSWVSMFALQAFAITSSLARVQESHLKQQLFEQNAELVDARSALAQKSQMEERLRIAGDLHDSIGHQLTALRLQLEALFQVVPEEIKPTVAISQQLSSDLLENIRGIVKRMSREESIDLGSVLQQMDSDTPGVTITLTTAIPIIDAGLKQQLIPCIKEGVSNAIRHSGADSINIAFIENRLFIDDNGKGLVENSSIGFGLSNLKQRLAVYGGQVELNNRTPSGCQLSITLETGIAWESEK